MLSYLYGFIIDCANNAPGAGKNVVDGLEMELLGKLTSNNTSKIGPSPWFCQQSSL